MTEEYTISVDNDVFIDEDPVMTFEKAITSVINLISELSENEIALMAERRGMKAGDVFIANAVHLLALRELHAKYHLYRKLCDLYENEEKARMAAIADDIWIGEPIKVLEKRFMPKKMAQNDLL